MNKEDFFFNSLNVIFKEDVQQQIHQFLKQPGKISQFCHGHVAMSQEHILGMVRMEFVLPGAVQGPCLDLLPEKVD